jgi:DNA-binding CsgD family transcriptional regulator
MSLNSLEQHLNCVIPLLPGMAAWKDADSIYRGINHKACSMLGFNSLAEAIGKSDYELKCQASDHADTFVAQDKQVLLGNQHQSIDLCFYADNNLHVLLTEKKALQNPHNSKKPIGTMHTSLDLGGSKIAKVLAQVSLSDKYFNGQALQQKKQQSYKTKGSFEMFSKREAECLFFLMRGKTAREVAQLLFISPRTVESHIANMRGRLDMPSLGALVSWAVEQGMIHEIPESLFTQRVLERL